MAPGRVVAVGLALSSLALSGPVAWAQRFGPPAPTMAIPDVSAVAAGIGVNLAGSILGERDFLADPALAAKLEDLVVLELEPAPPRGRSIRENRARYRLDAGAYLFCFDDDESRLVSLVVDNAAGKHVLRVDRRSRARARPGQSRVEPECRRVTLRAGVYTLRIAHDARRIGSAPRPAFVRLATAGPSLVTAGGQPVGGLWALRPDPGLDPGRRPGRVVAPPPDRSVPGTPFTEIRPLVADFASTVIDGGALFDLSNLNEPLVGAPPGTPLNLAVLDASGDFTAFGDDGPTGRHPFFQDAPLMVTDLRGYQTQLGVQRENGTLASFFLKRTAFADTTMTLNYDRPGPDPAPARVDVLFRFFLDGTQIGPLQAGEVAIFQECNYQGKAAVFVADTPQFGALTSPLITLDKTAASVRLGNNTAVLLNSGPLYTGVRQLVVVDTPCLSTTPIGTNNTSSILVRPIAPFILSSSRSCVGCKLEGVDLSGMDLSGMDLRQADLTGANLAGVSLKDVLLTGAILDQVTGLANSDQSEVDLSNVSLRQVDLGGAKLYGAQLNQADLEGANLGGAFLTNNQGAGIAQAASLVGAHLKNVNLAGAQLSGANLSNASFYGTKPAGTGKCKVAGRFTDGCATAAGATMNNTQFGGAYLYGVDFTDNSTVQGVQFNGAVLIGANFGGATISVDPSVGTNTGFSNAYLQGTSLAGATLTSTSLFNAFLDFRVDGNSAVLLLNEKYSNFPNWHAPGQPICISVAYGNATTVPVGNTTLTCPDGSSAAGGGCGPANSDPPLNPRWASTLAIASADPPVSYLADATYTKAGAPICDIPDLNW